jgi:hypothetical protein
MTSREQTPHATRRGRLKNGNPPGDISKAAHCGAKTRSGAPCKCRAMPNGRCRLHGGLSTGAKTAAGIERIRQARMKDGTYSAAAKAERRFVWLLIKESRAQLRRIEEVR